MAGRGKGSCGLGAHSKRPIHPSKWAECSDEERTEILSHYFNEKELQLLAEIPDQSVVPKLLAMISDLEKGNPSSKKAIMKIGTENGKRHPDGDPKFHGERLMEWTMTKNEKDMGDYFDSDERSKIELTDLPPLIAKIRAISVALKRIHKGNEELIKSIYNIHVA